MLKITLFPQKPNNKPWSYSRIWKLNFSVRQMLYFYIMLEKLPLVFNNSFCKFSLISKNLVNIPSNFCPGLILATHRNSPICWWPSELDSLYSLLPSSVNYTVWVRLFWSGRVDGNILEPQKFWGFGSFFFFFPVFIGSEVSVDIFMINAWLQNNIPQIIYS